MVFMTLLAWDLGGTELRFLDIFLAARQQKAEITLIAPKELIKKFLLSKKISKKFLSNILTLNCKNKNKIDLIFEYIKILKKIPCGSHFHYPINFLWPLHIWRGDKTSCSVVLGSYPKNRSVVKIIFDIIGFYFSKKIDVLNPAVFNKLKPFFTKKIHLTPNGSFILRPLLLAKKTKNLNLLMYGRFVPEKGIKEFLNIYEDILCLLPKKYKDRVKFTVAGYGFEKNKIIKKIKDLNKKNKKIKLILRPKLNLLFKRKSILISNQKYTNYPSRCIVEALTSGCPALVRNSGDSNAFGKKHGLVFYKFNKIDLANKLVRIFKKMLTIKYGKKIRQTAIKNFCKKKLILNYFINTIFRS